MLLLPSKSPIDWVLGDDVIQFAFSVLIINLLGIEQVYGEEAIELVSSWISVLLNAMLIIHIGVIGYHNNNSTYQRVEKIDIMHIQIEI